MAFIATCEDPEGRRETLGVVRAISDPDGTLAEFAILVRSDLKGKGLGTLLLRKIVAYGRGRGIGRLTGEVLERNARMLALARDLGFAVARGDGPGTCRVTLDLAGRAA